MWYWCSSCKSSCKTLAETKATAKSAAIGILHLRWRVHMLLLQIFMAGLWNLWNCSATDPKNLNFRSDNHYRDYWITYNFSVFHSLFNSPLSFLLSSLCLKIPTFSTFLYFHLPFLSFSALAFFNIFALCLYFLLLKWNCGSTFSSLD